MTTITIFNSHNQHEKIAPGAFERSIGKKVALRGKDRKIIGVAKILDVLVTDEGVETTLETDADLGIWFRL